MKSVFIKAAMQSMIVCFFLVGLVLPWSHVSASLRSCHTDPKLTFSNGTKLTVTATINADESSVVRVVYTVHAPAGVALIKTVYTAAGWKNGESVILINDQMPGVYLIDTVVTAQTPDVQVSTTSTIGKIGGTTAGNSGDHLVVTLLTSLASKK